MGFKLLGFEEPLGADPDTYGMWRHRAGSHLSVFVFLATGTKTSRRQKPCRATWKNKPSKTLQGANVKFCRVFDVLHHFFRKTYVWKYWKICQAQMRPRFFFPTTFEPFPGTGEASPFPDRYSHTFIRLWIAYGWQLSVWMTIKWTLAKVCIRVSKSY